MQAQATSPNQSLSVSAVYRWEWSSTEATSACSTSCALPAEYRSRHPLSTTRSLDRSSIPSEYTSTTRHLKGANRNARSTESHCQGTAYRERIPGPGRGRLRTTKSRRSCRITSRTSSRRAIRTERDCRTGRSSIPGQRMTIDVNTRVSVRRYARVMSFSISSTSGSNSRDN